MEDYCHRTVSLLSFHMELIYAAELLIMIVVALMGYFILQKINLMKLEAQALYDFNKLEIVDNAFESDDSAEFDNQSDEEGGGGGGDTKKDQSVSIAQLISSCLQTWTNLFTCVSVFTAARNPNLERNTR